MKLGFLASFFLIQGVKKFVYIKQRRGTLKILFKTPSGIESNNSFLDTYSPECELQTKKQDTDQPRIKNALKRKFEKDLELGLAEVFRRGFEDI